VQWLTVPVLTQGQGRPLTRDVHIDNTSAWRRKHLESLQQNYRRAPFAEWTLSALAPIYARDWDRLVELDLALLDALMKLLGLSRRVVSSSTLAAAGNASERLVALCKAVGATRFYEGASGRNYIDGSVFDRAGITLEYQDYRHPVYPQLRGPFVSHLSVVDLLCNCGPESLNILIS
jgi:hypothetical protein